jgi:short-subunit dehydrogenase involved in D-alanine esterification of teichoic acids
MLREFAKQEEIDKYQNALYDFNTNIVEEGYVPPSVEEEQNETEEDDANKMETEEEMDVKESLSKIKLDDEEENEGV